MDESQKKYLSDTENYNDTILNDEMDVVRAFIDIINEYLFHGGDKIVITNHQYYIFVLKRGCDTIKHIFNILFMFSALVPSESSPKTPAVVIKPSSVLGIRSENLPDSINKSILGAV